ncbi:MAG: alpha/beta fold hydrolase [Candidatus Hermodarchaeota archaeon]
MHLENFTKKSLCINDDCISYLDNERDSPSVIFLIHGWMERKEHFFLVVKSLPPSMSNTRIIMLDLRGHGDSSKLKTSSYQIEDFCDDILAIVAQENLDTKSLSFVGHSFGGIVALITAKSLENKVNKVFLLNTNPGNHSNKPLLAFMTSFFTLNKRFTAYLIRKMGSFTPKDPGISSLFLESVRLTPRFVIKQLALETISRPLFSFLSDVPFPIVLITGDLDKLTPRSTGDDFRTLSPFCNHIIFQDVGHYSPLVVPERTAQIIARFLEESPRTDTNIHNLEELIFCNSNHP